MRMSIFRSPFFLLLPSSSYSLLASTVRSPQTLRTATSNTLNNSAWFVTRVGRTSSSTARFMSTSSSMNQSSNHNNRVALLQFHVSQSKEQNHIKALDFMTRAVTEGKAQLLVLVCNSLCICAFICMKQRDSFVLLYKNSLRFGIRRMLSWLFKNSQRCYHR
jgi:hypothetical protein